MLYIYLNPELRDDCIKNTVGRFNRDKEKDWFNSPLVRKIIKDIDNSVVVKDEYNESPVFGGMSPDRLSGGCKTVILLECIPSINVLGNKCGENCACVAQSARALDF